MFVCELLLVLVIFLSDIFSLVDTQARLLPPLDCAALARSPTCSRVDSLPMTSRTPAVRRLRSYC